MGNELPIILLSAGSIAFLHTLLGPDHYLPFIMMSRSRNWSLSKTSLVTFICGSGHVLSSVLLGVTGVGFGLALTQIAALQSLRGNIAAWIMIAFGLVYSIWGLKVAVRNKSHKHLHSHGHGNRHVHSHTHYKQHVHSHSENKQENVTPWILFTIFILGPCEPLIPLLMYPAAKQSFGTLISVTAVFATVTILTMMSIVLASAYGIRIIPFARLSRYTHAMAGTTILLCGAAIQFLGY